MSTRSIAFFLPLFAILVAPVWADTDSIVTSARGLGTTPEAAKKDALINAMQQAIGTLIDSETMIANDDVIKEKFLAVSDGFVSKYDIVTPATSRADGLYEISINATVQKGKVVKRLEEVRVVSGKVSGKDLAAEAITKIANAEQGNELLAKNLEGLLEKLLIARLIGEDGKPNPGMRPIIEIQSDKRVKCTWNIEVYFDMQAFYKQAAPKIDKLLSTIGTKAGSAIWFGQRSSSVCYATKYPVLTQSMWQGNFPKRVANQRDYVQTAIFLSIGRDKFGENERFRWHVIDSNVYGAIVDRLQSQVLGTRLHFYTIDTSGGVIREDVVPITYVKFFDSGKVRFKQYFPEFFSVGEGRVGSGETCQFYLLSPRFSELASYGKALTFRERGCTDTIVLQHESIMEKEDIERISEVRFQFKRSTGGDE